ncbi:MAG: hypothetical protein JSR85_02600 [Proteobacteria bacterium]|nr:hypothetical protein [Pseudomonadota bacterium]
MRNLVLTAVSVVALMAASGANAQDKGQAGAPDASKMMDLQPAPQAGAPQAAAPAMPKAAPMAKAPAKRHIAPHKVRHHKPHHHKHHHKGGAYYPVEVQGVYVTFPPMDVYGSPVCNPEYFWGKTDCPYAYHGGYFWYPHSRADMLKDYAPYNAGGVYWYASHMHPYMVYGQRMPMAYTYPYPLYAPHPMDRALYQGQPAPMAQKWGTAPDIRAAEAE